MKKKTKAKRRRFVKVEVTLPRSALELMNRLIRDTGLTPDDVAQALLVMGILNLQIERERAEREVEHSRELTPTG